MKPYNKIETTIEKTEIHKLRKVILGYLYEASDLLGRKFEWTKVRIVNTQKMKYNTCCEKNTKIDFAGLAWFDHKEFHVNENFVNSPHLKHIVFHELLHTWLGIRHDDKKILMNTFLPKIPMTNDELINEFLEYKK